MMQKLKQRGVDLQHCSSHLFTHSLLILAVLLLVIYSVC